MDDLLFGSMHHRCDTDGSTTHRARFTSARDTEDHPTVNVTPLGTSGSYTLNARGCTKPWRYMHHEYSMTIVMNGTSLWRSRGRLFTLSGPALLVARPQEPQICVRVETPLELSVVFIRRPPDSAACGTQFDLPRVGDWNSTQRAMAMIREAKPTEQERRLVELLGELESTTHPPPRHGRSPTPPIRRAASLLRDSYEAKPDAPPRLEDVAHAIGYSYHHFCHAFKDEMGLPPYQFVKALRRSRAQELMMAASSSDKPTPLANVALAAGYADGPHMSRDFKSVFGITPGRWQRGLKRESIRPPA